MQSDDLQIIMGYYIEDAQNHLAAIEQHLLNLQHTIEDPERVSNLFQVVRCGIVGGASLLPVSSHHINSIHQTGFCLVDCLKVFQQEGSVKVDQKLEDLLMQVFYTLKGLIEQLKESSDFTDDRAKQIVSDIEPVRGALMAHLNGLVTRSRNGKHSPVAISTELDEDISSLEDLESIIDELSLDSASTNLGLNSQDNV